MEQVGYWKDGCGALSPPEGRYIECDCGCEIYDGETAYMWDGETLCEGCVKEKALAMLPGDLADMLGLLRETVRA